jgi:hypothetical protein
MNKLFYTELTMGGYKEYAVTLLAGEWSKYRTFASAADAKRCVADLKHIKNSSALAALEQFMRYGIKGQWRVSLSSLVKQGSQIAHCTICLDGTGSIWIATLQGDYLECSEAWRIQDNRFVRVDIGSNTYTSLNAFIRAHYAKVRPERKGGNGWNECKTQVNGKWIKMSELRLTR